MNRVLDVDQYPGPVRDRRRIQRGGALADQFGQPGVGQDAAALAVFEEAALSVLLRPRGHQSREPARWRHSFFAHADQCVGAG